MSEPPTAPLSPEERLAAWLEGQFRQQQQTLTDTETAETFRLSLRLVRTALEGAHAQGVVDEEQHRELDGIFAGMERAPGLLA